MTIDEKSIRRKLYEAANINGWITAEQAAAIAEQHLALLESPEVVEREVFIEQVFEALRSGKIQDIDTNWRMANKVLPRDFSPWRKQDQVEISACYRKVHLSDVLQAARDIINHYHSAAITSFIKGDESNRKAEQVKLSEEKANPPSPTSYAGKE